MKKKLFLFLFSIFVFGGGFYGFRIFGDTHVDNYEDFHFADPMDKDLYEKLEGVSSEDIFREKVYGGIVSHHFLVAKEISSFFEKMKGQKPKNVVILAPNHYGFDEEILVSKYPYNTPWGILEPNNEIIDKILQNNLVENDEKPFETEHSISTLVGFIKKTFPETKIIPIIIKKGTSKERLDLLVKRLNSVLPEDTLVLASVDFSHHLNRIAANFHDEKSISTISSFSLDNIFKLEIDSSASVYILLNYLKGKEAQKMEYINTNSADLFNNLDSEDVTSYLFAHFLKGKPLVNEDISFLNFGDSMFDRGVKKVMSREGDPFKKIKGPEGNFLKGVDFILLNLEGPISDSDDCSGKELSFRFDLSIARYFFENNINLVNFANNHSFDCWEKGIIDTYKNLDVYGVGYFGGYTLEKSFFIKDVGGKKIAFVGIDETVEPIKLDNFYSLVKELKKENDYIVVNIHWGYEYDLFASKIQREIAYLLIDNGADIIIGHHPHVMQQLEIYKGKPIFYSLGNFIFDQLTEETNRGFGVGTILNDSKKEFFIFPYKIEGFLPELLPYNDTSIFCEDFLKDVQVKDTCRFELVN